MEDWQLVAVADALKRASDVGESRSRSALQEECGIGSGDLEAALDALRESGAAWEVEPGVYSSGPEPAVTEDDPVAAVEAPSSVTTPVADPVSLPGRPRETRAAGITDPVRVSLPAGVAGAMDEATLGQLVKSGVEQAGREQRTFVFETTP